MAAAHVPAPTRSSQPWACAQKLVSARELRGNSGTAGGAIHLAVLGRVFDVSHGRKHYGASAAARRCASACSRCVLHAQCPCYAPRSHASMLHVMLFVKARHVSLFLARSMEVVCLARIG